MLRIPFRPDLNPDGMRSAKLSVLHFIKVRLQIFFENEINFIKFHDIPVVFKLAIRKLIRNTGVLAQMQTDLLTDIYYY